MFLNDLAASEFASESSSKVDATFFPLSTDPVLLGGPLTADDLSLLLPSTEPSTLLVLPSISLVLASARLLCDLARSRDLIDSESPLVATGVALLPLGGLHCRSVESGVPWLRVGLSPFIPLKDREGTSGGEAIIVDAFVEREEEREPHSVEERELTRLEVGTGEVGRRRV